VRQQEVSSTDPDLNHAEKSKALHLKLGIAALILGVVLGVIMLMLEGEASTQMGWILLAMTVLIRWWRVVIPVALSQFVAWGMSAVTSIQSVWIWLPLLVIGLVVGVMWQRKIAAWGLSPTS